MSLKKGFQMFVRPNQTGRKRNMLQELVKLSQLHEQSLYFFQFHFVQSLHSNLVKSSQVLNVALKQINGKANEYLVYIMHYDYMRVRTYGCVCVICDLLLFV